MSPKGKAQNRRSSPRVSCKFGCTIDRDGQTVQGTVLDISERGLLVRLQGSYEKGEAFRLRLRPTGERVIPLDVFVWHSRSDRRRKDSMVGMVISVPNPDFTALLERTAAAAPKAEPVPAPAEEPKTPFPSPPEAGPDGGWFKATLVRRGANDQKSLTVFAKDVAQARTMAQLRAGTAWRVAEVIER